MKTSCHESVKCYIRHLLNLKGVASDDRITNVISDLYQLCRCQKNYFKVISQVFTIGHKSNMVAGLYYHAFYFEYLAKNGQI